MHEVLLEHTEIKELEAEMAMTEAIIQAVIRAARAVVQTITVARAEADTGPRSM